MKHSAKPYTAGPNRLPDETRLSRKGTLSLSLVIQTSILTGEHLGLEDLKHSHRVQCRSRLSSHRVGASSECRSGSARLGRMAHPRLPSDSRGWAEMRGHGLIQREQVLISILFSVVNGGEGSRGRSTDTRRVEDTPRFSELVMDFREEGGRALARGLMAPREKRPACCEMAPQAETTRTRAH